MYHFQSFRELGRFQQGRLLKSVKHRSNMAISDEENCTLCPYYKLKREHCRGCPAYEIYVRNGHRQRGPYTTVCEFYQRLSDRTSYPDGSRLPAELFIERLLKHRDFLEALEQHLAEHNN